MHASTLERARIAGPAGAIETDINDPGDQRRGFALIAHPHPLQGGTKDNKVVTTLAKAFFSLDYVVMRPNFRGAGSSEGVHDEGRGETEDLLVVVQYAKQRYGELPLVLAGFSFGSFVQSQVARRVAAARLILVAPAVNRFATETVPANTLVIHGERDDVVPLGAVLDWARPQNLPVVVVPGGEHFFHGRLSLLSRIVLAYCH
ncbi:MAG TPA: alpha/beta hydrolase [Burkholderiales bacterium]|nr:alpha/beta hydrolase [Burkholderiales bacterium]